MPPIAEHVITTRASRNLEQTSATPAITRYTALLEATATGQFCTFSMYFTYGESERTTISCRCENGTYLAAAITSGAVISVQPRNTPLSKANRFQDQARWMNVYQNTARNGKKSV